MHFFRIKQHCGACPQCVNGAEEEFFAKIDRAEKQTGKSFASVEELDKYIRSL